MGREVASPCPSPFELKLLPWSPGSEDVFSYLLKQHVQ